MAASTIRQWVFRQFKEGMKKNNKGHQKTLERQMFPQGFPQGENGGETNLDSKCAVTPDGTGFMTA